MASIQFKPQHHVYVVFIAQQWGFVRYTDWHLTGSLWLAGMLSEQDILTEALIQRFADLLAWLIQMRQAVIYKCLYVCVHKLINLYNVIYIINPR